MDRTISAPGKLFLSGEYAVLWGGEARIVAVGPRARAVVRGRADRQVHVALAEGRLSGQATPAGVRWEGGVPEAFRFVATTLDLALRLQGSEGPGFSVALEPSPLVDGHKLGLGSSARATVLAAEAARVGLQASFDAFKLALLAHADAQGGKGSGGDVAASFVGGVVRYRRYEVSALLSASRSGGLGSAFERSAPVALARPAAPALPMLYAFSGKGASTPSLVRQIEQRLDPVGRQRFVERSDALGAALEQATVRPDFTTVRDVSAELQALLWELGATRDEALERVLALAATFGCAGKQSGAGGGDGALLFAPDEGARAALSEALAARGLLAFPVSVERGLSGEVSPSPLLGAWLDALD